MSVKRSEATHHIRLKSESTAPATDVELLIAEDEKGNLRWEEGRTPFVAPRISQDAISYSHRDPKVDFVWAQGDFSGGALAPKVRDTSHNKYAWSYGVDASAEGVVATGFNRTAFHRAGYLIRDPGFESGGVSAWTVGTGVAAAVQSTNVFSQDSNSNITPYACRLTTDGGRSQNDVLLSQALQNPTKFQGKTVVIFAALRRVSGSDGIKMSVTDGVSTTSSSSSHTSSTYDMWRFNHVVNGAASELTLRLLIDANEGGVNVFDIDDWGITLATASNDPSSSVCAGIVELAGSVYGAFGKTICKWDNTNLTWDLVHVSAGDSYSTDIMEFQGNVYVAFGTGEGYVYGSDTTWTVSNRVAPDDKAIFWAKSRDTLYKTETTSSIASTTDGTNGAAAWSAPDAIGSSDKQITHLYSFNDTIAVGKEDGFWLYNRVANDWSDADAWKNVTNEFDSMSSTENFGVGAEWRGWLYLTAARQSFFRYNTFVFEDLHSTIIAPRLTDFGGRMRAMAADTNRLWMVVDPPVADTTPTKDSWLLGLSHRDGRPIVHTFDKLRMTFIDYAKVATVATTGVVQRLFVEGRNYVSVTGGGAGSTGYLVDSYVIDLPEKSAVAYLDPTASAATYGYLRTSTWDGNTPDIDKALLSLTLYTADCDANQTIVVSWVGDDQATTTLGTFNTSPVQTIFFSSLATPISDAVEKQLSLQFFFTTDGVTSPKLYDFILHTVLSETPLKTWGVVVVVGNKRNLLGLQEENSKATQLSAISALEAQDYPFIMEEDWDGDDSVTENYVRLAGLRRLPDEQQLTDDGELYQLLFQEHDVA